MTRHSIQITVRGYHLDFYGHVNNARYLEFLEEARWDMLAERIDLARWQSIGLAFTIVRIDISYRRAATLGDVLEVRSLLSRVGRKSAVVHQEVFLRNTSTLVADADVTFAIVETKTGKALPLKGDIADALNILHG
jgi:thioesterase-3